MGEMGDPGALELDFGASPLSLSGGSGNGQPPRREPQPPKPPKPPRTPKERTPLQNANSATRLHWLQPLPNTHDIGPDT